MLLFCSIARAPFPEVSSACIARCSLWRIVYFFLLLSETTQSTSSRRQFVQGAPCSTTLHLTLRFRQLLQAFDALRFTLLVGRVPLGFSPASPAVLFAVWDWPGCVAAVSGGGGEEDESEIDPSSMIEPILSKGELQRAQNREASLWRDYSGTIVT